jgi:hypothetical protein
MPAAIESTQGLLSQNTAARHHCASRLKRLRYMLQRFSTQPTDDSILAPPGCHV